MKTDLKLISCYLKTAGEFIERWINSKLGKFSTDIKQDFNHVSNLLVDEVYADPIMRVAIKDRMSKAIDSSDIGKVDYLINFLKSSVDVQSDKIETDLILNKPDTSEVDKEIESSLMQKHASLDKAPAIPSQDQIEKEAILKQENVDAISKVIIASQETENRKPTNSSLVNKAEKVEMLKTENVDAIEDILINDSLKSSDVVNPTISNLDDIDAVKKESIKVIEANYLPIDFKKHYRGNVRVSVKEAVSNNFSLCVFCDGYAVGDEVILNTTYLK